MLVSIIKGIIDSIFTRFFFFQAKQEVVIVTSYETSMRTAHNFLSVFLRKCAMKGDNDYRPLFENFVYDLLSTVNKPEWPAAELLLSLLGRLLVSIYAILVLNH